jgi:flavorubredoxin
MELCKDAIVITSPNGEKGLKKHYNADWKMQVVDTGDSVNIGKRTISFVLTQMVHWPDSMVTYIPEEKLLLPNDAFGQHIASPERFDDELGWDVLKEEAAKYYANIVLPFGSQVQKALEAVSGLDIDMIAPSHGIIWRKYLKDIIGLYGEWSANKTKEKAVIIYDSMWHSTEKIAEAIYCAFEEKGVPVRPMDLKNEHISNVMMQVLDAKYIYVGSPTLNNGMLPTVAAFLTYMKGLAPKNRKGLAFGSYGWGGQSIPQIETILKDAGFDVAESVKVQYVPDDKTLEEIKNKVKGGIE